MSCSVRGSASLGNNNSTAAPGCGIVPMPVMQKPELITGKDRLDVLGMDRLIADKIQADPTLLQTGLDNIDRWIANGSTQVHRLEEWRALILNARKSEEGLRHLLALLREDSESAAHLRDFAPFAGILTAQDRRPFLLACAFAH